MKQRPVSLSPRAALFIGAALLSTPALAQEQTVSPPPVVSTVTPAPAPAPQPRIVIAPQAPVVQAVPETAAPEAAPARTTARRAATRTTTATRTVTRAPTAAAPAPEPAPVVEQPAPETVAPPAETAAIEPAPAPEQAAPAEPVAPAQNAPIWPWALLGALVLAGAAIALMLRRRRTEDVVYEEPVYAAPVAAEPVPVAEEPRYIARPEVAPAAVVAAVAAEPVREPFVDAVSDPIETEAVVHDAEKADLAGVIDGDAPVAHRPWLEFGMRPVRAGTTEEEATVEIELTVGNTGDMPATNVHISTFMLTDAEGSEMEDLLLQHAHDDTVPPVSIPAGEGTRIDATLATPKGELGRTFNPIVIADARYTLPDGSEGRTAAAFRIGRPAVEEGLGAIGATRPHMVDNVEAELERVLERV